jgi:antitoxin StbD
MGFFMEQILADYSVSITELRKRPGELLRRAGGQTIAILSHNKPAAYLVSPGIYRAMLEALEEKALATIVEARKSDLQEARTLKLDEL